MSMADAPKLLGTDTLRQAYPKFNQAIDNANEALGTANTAKSTADNAVTTANAANAKSDDTQQQLNNIVINNGQSDAEVLQARGTFVVLNDRLNDADSQLADVLKDTTDLQTTINDFANRNVKLTLKRKIYEVTASLLIPSNVEVDFNHSTIKRKTGAGVFDLIKNADTVNGNTDIKLYNLKIDGNKDVDLLVAGTEAHRFSGLKLVKVTNSTLKNIDVIKTVNSEEQGNVPAAGIYFEDCSNVEGYNLNGSYNDRTAIFLNRSKVKIDGSKTHDNLGSGISSANSDDSEYFNIETWNNGYSNLSVNGKRSLVDNVRSWGSSYSGVNIGHNGFPSDDTQIANIISYNNTYEGLTIGGSTNVQGVNIHVYGNARNNIRVFESSAKTKLLNVDSHDSAGGHGVLYESGEGHMIDNVKAYKNYASGINVGTNAKVKIGNNHECYNNGQGASLNSAGLLLNAASGCEVGAGKYYDNQATKTQESGIWIAGGSDHKLLFPTIENNKTYQLRKTSSPTNIIEHYPNSGVAAVSSFLNSWAGTGVNYEKDASGYVHVWGRLNTGTVGTAAFNLPVGFRPGSTINRVTTANGTGAYVGISTNGDFVPYVSNVNHDFDITFKQVL